MDEDIVARVDLHFGKARNLIGYLADLVHNLFDAVDDL